MKNRFRNLISAAGPFFTGQKHRIVTIEQTRYCNRQCSYCDVPNHYNPSEELSIEESKELIDKLYSWGFKSISYLGGEPLSDHITKEGIPIFEHTIKIISYASKKGLFINLTSNGDYLTKEKIHLLAEAGVNSLCLSLHNLSLATVDKLVEKLIIAAKEQIIPVLTTVFTSDRGKFIPGLAAYVTDQGILFSIGLCQDYGGPFSKKCDDLVPTYKQQKYVFSALQKLKHGGLIRSNNNYLNKSLAYFPNNWKCNPKHDSFLHIGAGGVVNVCSEIRTHINFADINTLDDSNWRKIKNDLVTNCSNCLNQCYFETENPCVIGDFPMAVMSMLISIGKFDLVQRWGKFFTRQIVSRSSQIDWDLRFPVDMNTPTKDNYPNSILDKVFLRNL